MLLNCLSRLTCAAVLISIASLGTLTAGLAHAETSLTLYGVLDTGIAYLSNSPGAGPLNLQGTQFGIIQGVQSGNRWGLRGAESLGNGYSVNFALEDGFNLLSGTLTSAGTEFNRQAWLELTQAELGRIRLGRQYNFAHQYFDPIDPFKPGSFLKATMGASFGSINTVRLNNSISYETPSLQGFQAGVGYSFAVEKPISFGQDGLVFPFDKQSSNYNFATNNNTRAITTGVLYESGPYYLSAIYDAFYPDAAVANGNFPAVTEWVLGGAYSVEGFKVSAAIGQTRHGWINPVTLTNPAVNVVAYQNANGNILFDPNLAVNSYMLGFETSIGRRGDLFGSWQMAQPTAAMLANTLAATSNQSIFSLGYTYQLSAQTNIYSFASYAMNFGMVSGLQTFSAGVGLRHQF